MRSRDIFRPLAAAKRGCRSGDPPTSIFRRGQNRTPARDDDGAVQPSRPAESHSSESDTYVVSVPPGPWPPHQGALSSGSEGSAAAARRRQINPGAPLPTGTASGSVGDDHTASPSRKTDSREACSAAAATPPPPSYYKIALVQGCDDMVQLTAGDDSSVELHANHNQQLIQLADVNSGSSSSIVGRIISANKENIIRASPIMEHSYEAIEHDLLGASTRTVSAPKHDASTRWTISDNGQIIVIPPSPSRVSTTHFKKPWNAAPGSDDNASSGSAPPSLVKLGGDDDSSQSDDSFLSAAHLEETHSGSESLESPPRMNRSVIKPINLFRDSPTGGRDGGGADAAGGRKHEGASCGNSRSPSRCSTSSGGGCGARSFFEQILDVFSSNCCRQVV